MAAADGKQAPSVIEQLFTEGYRFDFYQAVKLLEQLAGGGVTPGEAAPLSEEPVHFRGHISQSFPASDVQSVQAGDANGPPQLTANVLSLAGAHGPLPPPYTELILERNRKGDSGFQAFLDLFHHRLLSLLYRQRKHLRLGMETEAPWQSRFADYLFSFIGLNTPGLRNRLRVQDHRLLFYAGLLAPQVRAASALEALLGHFFQCRVRVEHFQGQWIKLPEELHTRIGLGWQNRTLGENAVLGRRYWSQVDKYDLWVGPIGLRLFRQLLPMEDAFVCCCELARFHVGKELDFDLLLELRAPEVPSTLLSTAADGPRLGWSSWLLTRPARQNGVIRLSSKRHLFRDLDEATHQLLAELPPEERRDFLSRITKQYYPSGTTLIRQGVRNRSLYVLSSGVVHILQRRADNTSRRLAALQAGSVFGEGGLLTDAPPIASAITATACSLYEIPHDYIRHLMERCPRVESWLRGLYGTRLSWSGQ